MSTVAAMLEAPNALESRVIEIWRGNGRREAVIVQYLYWVRRFCDDCLRRGADVRASLTRRDVADFARRYSENHRPDAAESAHGASGAVHAWTHALTMLGEVVPEWEPSQPTVPLAPVLAEYCTFSAAHRGVAASTIRMDVRYLTEFLAGVCVDGRVVADMQIHDVDAAVMAASDRFSRVTLARMCCAIRCFLRFLHQTGRIPHDLAVSVVSPPSQKLPRPARALPWEDVQRLLAAVDVTGRTGRRDYALLLMMATYGMGAAEALALRLDDIDWRAGTLHVVRPKTGVEIMLPLLPAIGEALLAYLRDGRPRYSGAREVFLAMRMPHLKMTSSAVRFAVRDHAKAAGIKVQPLGGHILRHSHACRELELGAPPKVVGDILGHRDPASTSVYMRVATSRLRGIALPVPA
ncbi:MAG: tyrosine-type recombinase/integrase [Myxococcota bacterium]